MTGSAPGPDALTSAGDADSHQQQWGGRVRAIETGRRPTASRARHHRTPGVRDPRGGPVEAEEQPAEPRWSTRDRTRERELIGLIAELPEDDPRRMAARDELVTMHLPLAGFLARRFRDRGESLDDLTQVATIGLLKAVDRFDPERGVEFSTFATPTMVGEIKRHFRDKGWAIRVPRRLQELRISIGRATAELSQSTGRSPTVAELAEHLDVSQEQVLEGLESAQRLRNPVTRRLIQRRHRGWLVTGRHPRRRRPRARRGRHPRDAAPAGGHAGAAGAADHPHALLREHDPGADRGADRRLADARLPVVGQVAGPAAHGPGRTRGLSILRSTTGSDQGRAPRRPETEHDPDDRGHGEDHSCYRLDGDVRGDQRPGHDQREQLRQHERRARGTPPPEEAEPDERQGTDDDHPHHDRGHGNDALQIGPERPDPDHDGQHPAGQGLRPCDDHHGPHRISHGARVRA